MAERISVYHPIPFYEPYGINRDGVVINMTRNEPVPFINEGVYGNRVYELPGVRGSVTLGELLARTFFGILPGVPIVQLDMRRNSSSFAYMAIPPIQTSQRVFVIEGDESIEFHSIPAASDYIISANGCVYSLRAREFSKWGFSRYRQQWETTISNDDGKRYPIAIKRLVYGAWVHDITVKDTIECVDGKPYNVSVDNLRRIENIYC